MKKEYRTFTQDCVFYEDCTQHEAILDQLQEWPKTLPELRRIKVNYNWIEAISTKISELRKKGYNITNTTEHNGWVVLSRYILNF